MTAPARPGQDLRRAELLDAGAYLFSTRGFHATGMRDLAQQLDIKAGSLYYHISSKEDLLVEICSIGMDKLTGNIEHAMGGGETLAQKVRSILIGHVWIMGRYGDFLHCLETEHKHMPLPVGDEVRERLKLFHRRIDSIFRTAMEKGEAVATLDVEQARHAILAVLAHLTRLDTTNSEDRLNAMAEGMSDILIGGYARR